MDKKRKKYALKVLAAVCFILFVIFVYRCPVRLIFNVECPGCGLKRAFAHALVFDFADAWEAHPLFWLLGAETIYVFLVYFFPRLRINKTAELVTGVVTIILLAAVWIIKMFFMR